MFSWNGSIIRLDRKFGGFSSFPGNKGSQTCESNQTDMCIISYRRTKQVLISRKRLKIKAVWSCLVTKRSRSNLSWKLKHLSNESFECTSKIKFSWLTTTNISRPAVRICINLNNSFVYLHSIRSTSQPQSFHQVSFGSTWRWGCPHVFYAWGQDNRRAKRRLNTVKNALFNTQLPCECKILLRKEVSVMKTQL